jgi:hypothetical protein
MDSTVSRGPCGLVTFSELERHHGALAYTRPAGNLDVDADPSTTLFLRPPEIAARTVSCFLR